VKTYLVVFVSVFLAELGDKTQLATVLFATTDVSKTGVFLAAASALVTSTLIAVVIGSKLGQWAPPGPLKIIAGLGFLAVGAWVLVSGLRQV
jgi:putative Ca2+/H+ antiporter (TMEM165/GDT1 family)